jgi:protein-S-isoprenylcysteine O-methyltransferase Ste14
MNKIIIGILSVGGLIALFFWMAGSLNWARGWVYIGVLALGQSASILYVWRKNPILISVRSRLGKGTKKWDKALLGLFGLTYLAIAVVAALDKRYGWSSMGVWYFWIGIFFYTLSTIVLTWAMSINPYFEKTVRIQDERGHRVIDTGPYRLVRHPGYLGTIGGFLLTPPLMLGSWLAFIPALISTAILIIRTFLEDRTLRKELSGYEDYARQVPFKLFPGIW